MERSLRAGRLATFGYFALNGFVLGMWVVHIPAIEHRTGVGTASFGWLLLVLGGGAFAGMQLAGTLTDRYGARRVVPGSAALCSAAVVLPGLATQAWTLAGALLALGIGNGCLDVSMNAHAVQVEHGYRRPVMSAFHATFSIGGVIAALIGARTLSWDWSPAATLGAVALLGIVAAAATAPALLRPDPRHEPHPGPEPRPDGASAGGAGETALAGARTRRPTTRRPTPRRIWALAALALMVMLCEGVANDWSTLQLHTVLHASDATSAFGYGAFAAAMTVGRLFADRVAARLGPVAVLRHGAAVAAVGLACAALSATVPLTLVGWAVFGAGLSGCVPQLFSAAGHADREAAGANVSRVAGLGYLGMLAGPAIIGALTRLIPLNVAFLLPVALCAAVACAAGILSPRPGAAPGPGTPLEPAAARAR
ncbi:MFS transporter [Streptacidiphilus cavernicola]|uniref:MFS transporter n=1 Tax=Streptacidiphilus cavernicola TaxID=3342716 RepID=A0ABV6VP92_9ACTN